MSHKDKYTNFAGLIESESEGRDFRRIIQPRNSAITVISPHGGGIEPGTSEIATAIAGSEFSLYCFEGLKAKGNYEALHITGTNFDDPECLELTVKSRIVLAIHGCNDENKVVYVGGRNENLKVQIIEVLKGAGCRAEEDVSNSGRDTRNICNRGVQNGGVQKNSEPSKRATDAYTEDSRFVSPLRGSRIISLVYPGLTPGATLCRRFAAH